MVRAKVPQGVRQMHFEGLLERHERGELSQREAEEMPGLTGDRQETCAPMTIYGRKVCPPGRRRAVGTARPASRQSHR
jgi:hypothetical protein